MKEICSEIFYLTVYLSLNFCIYYGGFLYMIPIVQWMADEVEDRFRLELEHHRRSISNQTNILIDLFGEYNGDI